MRLDAFDYHLPETLIAQRPREDRSGSRLLVVDRSTSAKTHGAFRDIVQILEPGDVLVVNRSRVIPARLFLRRESGGRVELLVAKIASEGEFVAIGSPLRKLKAGDVLRGETGEFECRIIERIGDREVRAEFVSDQSVIEVLEANGHVPLPPYIRRGDDEADRSRYQTVYADENGSVAAPTAGLHFDKDVLHALHERGVLVRSVVLHVGLGTFMPLAADIVEDNVLHKEAFAVSGETIDTIRRTKESNRRVIAVGTTVTRVLEAVWQKITDDDIVVARGCSGETSLFIYPGFEFKVIDGLITNFHLPQSSLLLLVCAFLGTEATLACYREAVEARYRFYSYGDAMFIR
jgi:S-adenosylmethionine:tRNA ribosyltransferase-isomerase